MSTTYYRFRPPITSVRLEEGLTHDRLTVFENGANAGTLTLSKGDGRVVALCFAADLDDSLAPMRTHFGGIERGCVVTIQDKHIHDDTYLISGYGDVYRVREIKAMDGKGRRSS